MAGAPRTAAPHLPLSTAVSTSAGLASAAINFLACVEVAEYAGGQTAWLALVVAGCLIVLAGANFAELNGLYPSSAAVRVWLRRGFTDRVSMIGSLLYASTVIFVMAADAFVLGHALHQAIPTVGGFIWILGLLAVMVAVNRRGIRFSGRMQDINAFFLLGTLSALSLVILLRPHLPMDLARVAAPGWGRWFQGVAVGIFIYVGFEWVTPLAEAFPDAARTIPRGMFMALGLIAVAFGLFIRALGVLFPDPRVLGQDLAPQLTLGMRALGPLGFWWMAVITLTTAATTFNGGLMTASRFIYALARERVLPPGWARLNRHLVPQTALVGMALVALALAGWVWSTGQYRVLINAGAGVEALMYAMTGWAVIRLRQREPLRPRPFRVWGPSWLPWLGVGLYTCLGVGALSAPSGSSGFPWALVFIGGLAVVVVAYVIYLVPRWKRQQPVRPVSVAPTPSSSESPKSSSEPKR